MTLDREQIRENEEMKRWTVRWMDGTVQKHLIKANTIQKKRYKQDRIILWPFPELLVSVLLFSFHFARSSNNQQHRTAKLFIHLIYNGYLAADGNGAGLPARLLFVPSGRHNCKMKVKGGEKHQ